MSFSEPVVRELGRRVSHLCSNPTCGVETIGPHSDNSKATVIGEAAHICGEKPNAKRYDATMTDAQRDSIDNGIWLCRNCHKQIDSDESKYPVLRLHAWKIEAEAVAAERLGKAPPPAPQINMGSVVISIGQIGGQTAHTIVNHIPPPRTITGRTMPAIFVQRIQRSPVENMSVHVYADDLETRQFAVSIVDALTLLGIPCDRGVGRILNGYATRLTIYSRLAGESDPLYWLSIWLQSEGFDTDYRSGSHRNEVHVLPQVHGVPSKNW